jgi:hypothetical protein
MSLPGGPLPGQGHTLPGQGHTLLGQGYTLPGVVHTLRARGGTLCRDTLPLRQDSGTPFILGQGAHTAVHSYNLPEHGHKPAGTWTRRPRTGAHLAGTGHTLPGQVHTQRQNKGTPCQDRRTLSGSGTHTACWNRGTSNRDKRKPYHQRTHPAVMRVYHVRTVTHSGTHPAVP